MAPMGGLWPMRITNITSDLRGDSLVYALVVLGSRLTASTCQTVCSLCFSKKKFLAPNI